MRVKMKGGRHATELICNGLRPPHTVLPYSHPSTSTHPHIHTWPGAVTLYWSIQSSGTNESVQMRSNLQEGGGRT